MAGDMSVLHDMGYGGGGASAFQSGSGSNPISTIELSVSGR